mgnify:CR=1 FL=1
MWHYLSVRSKQSLKTGKPMVPARVSKQPDDTPQRIISATITALREEGFAGTSARVIARHGDFNQALIFYHFGSLPDLLIATLERIAEERLHQYRTAVAGVHDLPAAVEIARKQYGRDVAAGHITVLAELVAGASSMPGLGQEVVRCMDPWIDFTATTLQRLLRGTMLEKLVPARDAAHAVVAMYLGMELLDHLDPSSRQGRQLFRLGSQLVSAAAPLLGRRAAGRESKPERIAIT